jgi:hypothetical protein
MFIVAHVIPATHPGVQFLHIEYLVHVSTAIEKLKMPTLLHYSCQLVTYKY